MLLFIDILSPKSFRNLPENISVISLLDFMQCLRDPSVYFERVQVFSVPVFFLCCSLTLNLEPMNWIYLLAKMYSYTAYKLHWLRQFSPFQAVLVQRNDIFAVLLKFLILNKSLFSLLTQWCCVITAYRRPIRNSACRIWSLCWDIVTIMGYRYFWGRKFDTDWRRREKFSSR